MSDVSDEHWHIAMCVGEDNIFMSPPFDADDFEEALREDKVMFAAYLAEAEQDRGGKRLKQDVKCIGLWRCGFDLSDVNAHTLQSLL